MNRTNRAFFIRVVYRQIAGVGSIVPCNTRTMLLLDSAIKFILSGILSTLAIIQSYFGAFVICGGQTGAWDFELMLGSLWSNPAGISDRNGI